MICERAAAPIGEAPRQPKVLALLPRYSGRHPAAGGRVLPTITAKPAAPFLAFQKDWPFLVGASRSTLPCACSAGRSGHRVVLGRTACRVQPTGRPRVAIAKLETEARVVGRLQFEQAHAPVWANRVLLRVWPRRLWDGSDWVSCSARRKIDAASRSPGFVGCLPAC